MILNKKLECNSDKPLPSLCPFKGSFYCILGVTRMVFKSSKRTICKGLNNLLTD